MSKTYTSPTLQRLQLQISEQEKVERLLEKERIQRERREMIEWNEKIRQEEEEWN